jgi:hypothetical protein
MAGEDDDDDDDRNSSGDDRNSSDDDHSDNSEDGQPSSEARGAQRKNTYRVRRNLSQQIAASQTPDGEGLVAQVTNAFCRELAIPITARVTAPLSSGLENFVNGLQVRVSEEDEEPCHVDPKTMSMLEEASQLLATKDIALGQYVPEAVSVSRADLLRFFGCCGQPVVLGNLPAPLNSRLLFKHTQRDGLVKKQTILLYVGVPHSNKWAPARFAREFVEGQPVSEAFVAVILTDAPQSPDVPNATLRAFVHHLLDIKKKEKKAKKANAKKANAKKTKKAKAKPPAVVIAVPTGASQAPHAHPAVVIAVPTGASQAKAKAPAPRTLAALSAAACAMQRAAPCPPAKRTVAAVHPAGKRSRVPLSQSPELAIPVDDSDSDDDGDDDDLEASGFHHQEEEGEEY